MWRQLNADATKDDSIASGYAYLSTSRLMTTREYTERCSPDVSRGLLLSSSAINAFAVDAFDKPLAGIDAILNGECKNFSEYFESECVKCGARIRREVRFLLGKYRALYSPEASTGVTNAYSKFLKTTLFNARHIRNIT